LVSRVDIRLARGGTDLHELKIAFLSDLHVGTYMDESDLLPIFESLAREAPDMVCLGGDLINARGDEMLHYRRPLALLDPPLGMYAVPGNHEYAAEHDLKVFRDVLQEAGVRVLVNEGERVELGSESLWIAGVDDHCLGQPDLALALHGAAEHEPVILLSHHPDFFHEAASVGVDLTLSGHTHGGQIVIAGRMPSQHSVLGYWHGHHHDSGAQLYVSRGVGVTMLPLRIGAPAEVVLLRLLTA
jgi:predicted MPP superfamily phosphohydrolase